MIIPNREKLLKERVVVNDELSRLSYELRSIGPELKSSYDRTRFLALTNKGDVCNQRLAQIEDELRAWDELVEVVRAIVREEMERHVTP